MLRQRPTLIFLFILLLLSHHQSICRSQAHTATRTAKTIDPLVSLDVENVTLREALKLLFHQTGSSYNLSFDAERIVDHARRSAHLHGVHLQDALKNLLRGNDDEPTIECQIRSGIYFITRYVTLDLHDAEPQAALRALFRSINASFICTTQALGKSKITLSVKDVPPIDVLRSIVQQMHAPTQIEVKCVHDIYIVKSRTPSLPFDAAGTQPIAYELWDAPCRSVLLALFTAADLNVIVQKNLDRKITLAVQDKPFRGAMEAILHQYASKYPPESDQNLTYMVENGIYTILWADSDPGPQ